jgi:VanZ family protein
VKGIGVRRFAVFVLPILIYAGVIFHLSSRPLRLSVRVRNLDKAVHFVEYAGLGLLVGRALTGYGVSRRRALWTGIALGTVYGLSDELHQRLTPHRSFELSDLVADFLGSSAGAYLWFQLAPKQILPKGVGDAS